MPVVVEVATVPPRTISAPSGWAGKVFLPFVEITARAAIEVEQWCFREPVWLHWAVPVVDGSVQAAAAQRFDPGRRAAAPGEPDCAQRCPGAVPSRGEMAALADAVLRNWRCELHRHSRLELVSRVDEPLEEFLRRCRTLVGCALRAGAVAKETAAAEIHRLRAEIESHTLGAEQLRVMSVEVRLGWYPEGVRPDRTEGTPMVTGEPQGGR